LSEIMVVYRCLRCGQTFADNAKAKYTSCPTCKQSILEVLYEYTPYVAYIVTTTGGD
jgi:DNA-directed RNA polymerase subunit RPC12/RpoP